jgi:hypothetical protein
MEKLALIRAAEITLRHAICERYQPGLERDAWLRWAQRLHDGARRPQATAARNRRPFTDPSNA